MRNISVKLFRIRTSHSGGFLSTALAEFCLADQISCNFGRGQNAEHSREIILNLEKLIQETFLK